MANYATVAAGAGLPLCRSVDAPMDEEPIGSVDPASSLMEKREWKPAAVLHDYDAEQVLDTVIAAA